MSKKATAERLGLDRKTVDKYWDGPVDTPEAPRYGPRPRKIDRYMEYITGRLRTFPELSAERLYEDIKKDGYSGSARSVRRAVSGLRPREHREYKPVETLPGEQAQVDWGHFGRIRTAGGSLPLYAFVFCLAWSRVRYVEFITSLDMATFLACLHRAFEYIGGVPREMLFDNAKTVVSERVGGVIRYNENLLRAAAHYGFSPKACWSRDPESKGKVESNVKYVRSGFYYGRDYTDLGDLNRQGRQWCDEVANMKVHGTTGEAPFERLAQERAHLAALTVSEPMYIIESRSATKTQLISIGGNRYSVPARFARRRVKYRRYADAIEVLDGERVVDRIALVARQKAPVVCDRHYPEHQKKASRRPRHPLQARFEGLAPSAEAYLEGLSRSRTGRLREQMERIVELGERHPAERLEGAMKRSLDFGSFGYGVLKRILERQEKAPQSLREQPTPAGRRERPGGSGGGRVETRGLGYYAGLSR